MIKEDLVAERIAIESYGEIVRFLGDRDITSCRMMEEIWRTRRSTPTIFATCWPHSTRRSRLESGVVALSS